LVRLINKITVHSHTVSEDSLIYIKKNDSVVSLYNYPSEAGLVLEGFSGSLNYFKHTNSIYVNDLRNNKYIILNENTIRPEEGHLSLIDSGKHFLKRNTEENKLVLLDDATKELRSILNFPENAYQSIDHKGLQFFITNKTINGKIESQRSQILKYDYNVDSFEYLFNAENYHWNNEDGNEEKGFICQIIGVYKSGLLVHLSKYHIVYIDIQTGEILWEIQDFISHPDNKKYLSFGSSPVSSTPMEWLIDEENDRCILLSRHFCWHLDLTNKNCSLEKSFLNQDVVNQWNFQKTLLNKNRILFSGAKGFASQADTIGIYNIDSKSIDWEYKLEEGYFLDAPKSFNNLLVVADSNNYLHVLSEDNNSGLISNEQTVAHKQDQVTVPNSIDANIANSSIKIKKGIFISSAIEMEEMHAGIKMKKSLYEAYLFIDDKTVIKSAKIDNNQFSKNDFTQNGLKGTYKHHEKILELTFIKSKQFPTKQEFTILSSTSLLDTDLNEYNFYQSIDSDPI